MPAFKKATAPIHLPEENKPSLIHRKCASLYFFPEEINPRIISFIHADQVHLLLREKALSTYSVIPSDLPLYTPS